MNKHTDPRAAMIAQVERAILAAEEMRDELQRRHLVTKLENVRRGDYDSLLDPADRQRISEATEAARKVHIFDAQSAENGT